MDRDLWLLTPETRWGASSHEETIEGLEDAHSDLTSVMEMLQAMGKEAAWVIVWDAQQRVGVALERARERARENR